MTSVNLIPTQYRLRRKVAARKRIWIIVGMAYVVLLVMFYIFWGAIWNSDSIDGTNTLRLLRADIDSNEKMIDKTSKQIAAASAWHK